MISAKKQDFEQREGQGAETLKKFQHSQSCGKVVKALYLLKFQIQVYKLSLRRTSMETSQPQS